VSDDVYPHLYRHQFVAAVSAGGPASRPERRFLMVLTAMADHWSLVLPEPAMLASVFNIRVRTAREWLSRFHDEGWLSAVPGTDLSIIHLPEGSAAYQLALPSFEWHTRSHAPIPLTARPLRAPDTPVKRQAQDAPIPLTARALQLAAGSVGKTKKGQFAYISFVQQSLSDQPGLSEGLASGWDRYLEGR
jgi:hypothetical protein